MSELEGIRWLKATLNAALAELEEPEKQSRMAVIEYLLSDFEFDDEFNATAEALRAVSAYLDAPWTAARAPREFTEWYFLLALYFLDHPDSRLFPQQRRLDFGIFLYFLGSRYSGNPEKLEKKRQEQSNKARGKGLIEQRRRPLRELKEKAYSEYEPAAHLVAAQGKRITHEAIAQLVWLKIARFNTHPTSGNPLIQDAPAGDPIGRLKSWFEAAVSQGRLVSTKKLRKTLSTTVQRV